MNWQIDFKENSTKRGIVWVITFILGVGMIVFGFGNVDKLLLLAAGVAGGLGVGLKDSPPPT